MPDVQMLFWRAITGADFFNIERSAAAAPQTGGGQTYISLSFGSLTQTEFGLFLGVDPPTLIETNRPRITLNDVSVVTDPAVLAPIEFAPRYQLPQPDPRYRISRQNRQSQDRHPAWTRAYGFPEAPDDVLPQDPRLPDLTYLKVYVARLDNSQYVAGFFNSGIRPTSLPADGSFDILFAPFDENHSAGVIELDAGTLTLDALATAALDGASSGDSDSAPEVFEAVDQTKLSAGKRTSGQGRRQSFPERQAIELRAVRVATQHLEAEGWNVEDVGLYRPYDLHCTRDTEELRVEVKGTTGDGSAILLTPGEVDHARAQHPGVCLFVVSEIDLAVDPVTNQPTATGGQSEVTNPWDLDADGELRPTGFEYRRRRTT